MKNSPKRVKQSDIMLQSGRKTKHGGYSYIRSGKLPKDKRHVEKYLTFIREGYIHDIAKSEEDLTAAQLVLVNKLVMLEGLCRCIEIQAAERDALSMPQKYLQYVNTIIKICSMLGIERKELKDDKGPIDYIKALDRKE